MKSLFVLAFATALLCTPAAAQTTERRSTPSDRPAWLEGGRSDDPDVQICQFSALAIKIGMDDRREGLNESQSLARWTRILTGQNESATNIAIIVSGIRTAFRHPYVDYSVPDSFYYDCLVGMVRNR